MSLIINNDVVVSIDYTLTDESGKVLDTSKGKEPLKYLHGKGMIIPGLEKALTGKSQGDTFDVSIAPEEGYGQKRDELIQELDKSQFQGVDEVKPGMMFEAQGANGAPQPIVVKAVTDDKVTIDANHPLAGMTLNFNINIVTVREATPEELDHGHAH